MEYLSKDFRSGINVSQFRRNVKIPEDKNKCWFWIGTVDSNNKCVFDNADAAEISYYMANKNVEVSGDKYVLWNCGNEHCVNPKHLYLETYGDLSEYKCMNCKAPYYREANDPLICGYCEFKGVDINKAMPF